MHYLYLDSTDSEAVTVMHDMDERALPNPARRPLRASLTRHIELHRWISRKFLRTAHKIGVNMRLRNGGDAEPVLSRNRAIPIDIPFRIDDERLTGSLTPDEIGVLSEVRVDDLSQKHSLPLPLEPTHSGRTPSPPGVPRHLR
jgi:hypothetical protein